MGENKRKVIPVDNMEEKKVNVLFGILNGLSHLYTSGKKISFVKFINLNGGFDASVDKEFLLILLKSLTFREEISRDNYMWHFKAGTEIHSSDLTIDGIGPFQDILLGKTNTDINIEVLFDSELPKDNTYTSLLPLLRPRVSVELYNKTLVISHEYLSIKKFLTQSADIVADLLEE